MAFVKPAKPARTIDLNADLGESERAEDMERDVRLMEVVSSISIACGGHAGSERTMRAMVEAAIEKGCAVGAHPSYPDRANFGRQTMEISPDDLRESLLRQLGALRQVCDAAGTGIMFVKPHGALYNDMAADRSLADIVAGAVKEFDGAVALMGLAGGRAEDAARDAGLAWLAEGFADRRYMADGRLAPRSRSDAVIASPDERLRQAVAIATGRTVVSADGQELRVKADSICLHSDSDDALAGALAIRRGLEEAGLTVKSPLQI